MLVIGWSSGYQLHFCADKPGDTNLLYEVGVTGSLDSCEYDYRRIGCSNKHNRNKRQLHDILPQSFYGNRLCECHLLLRCVIFRNRMGSTSFYWIRHPECGQHDLMVCGYG